uniref:Rifampin ADP-ribosyl transferase n=1 Tax=Dictyoglomus thermophilum TaxID=14 RepID=A0A7C3RI95_DICTH
MVINPFLTIKEFLQKEIDISIFPLKDLIDQYYSLGENKWNDLELTTSFLDVTVEILESKIKRLFGLRKKDISDGEKKEDEFLLFSDDWRELVPYLKEKEERSLLIFRRDFSKKEDVLILNQNEKINLTEIYLLFLERKKSLIQNLNYLEDHFTIDIENKALDIMAKKEGKFSEIVKGKNKIDKICYFLALCDLANKGKVVVFQNEYLGEIIFKVVEDERVETKV